ncbi:MAG TPA: DUF1573 domain-containing protein [Planctomycetaceae bacterium]|nr:DUF1573 domain-containing protein [Planctomycetaceae bacterium]
MDPSDRSESRGLRTARSAVLLVFLAATLFLVARSAAFVRTIEQASAAGEARLVLEDVERDLGVVQPGAQIRETFRVHNAGSQRLVINEDRCGRCGPSGQRSSLLVAPGETATIEIDFHAPRAAGDVQHVVRYTTNDPERPRFQLTLRATVASTHDDAESRRPQATRSANDPRTSE